jgi:hypothetical protein
VLKLGLTSAATILLFVHMNPIVRLTRAPDVLSAELYQVRGQLLWDAALAMVALTALTAISISKPALLNRRHRENELKARESTLNQVSLTAFALLKLLAVFAPLHVVRGTGVHY